MAVIMTVATFAGCGKKQNEFIVGFDAEFPPFGYVAEDGSYTGFDLELAQEVCERRGWKLVKKAINWETKDALIASGEIDCIWNGFTMNGREDDYTWSVPYVNNSQVYVVRTDSGIKSQADLKNKKIGVQKASAALAALTSEDNTELYNSFDEVKEYDSYVIAFQSLEGDAIDALAMDIGVAKVQMAEKEAGEFTILSDYLSEEQYGIGFKLGNEKLKDKVEETLMEMVEDGTFMEIAKKYDLQDAVCLGK